jgi:voltage-gated potassium channel
MSRKNITEVIIGILAIVSIILVAIESLVSVSQGTLMGIYIADLLICIVFAVDFIQRLRTSESKSHFMKINGFEILAMIPAIALHALGFIPAISSALRALRLIRVIRIILLMARMRRVMSKSGRFFQRSHLLAMLGITIGIIFIGAFTVMLLESGTESAVINNFSDAVWWSISTVTTVGYGDIVPHSMVGRIVGMVLMVIGIGVMAAFISEVSATLVESRIKHDKEEDNFRTSIVTEIKNRIDNIDKLSDSEVTLLMQMIHTLRLEGVSNS